MSRPDLPLEQPSRPLAEERPGRIRDHLANERTLLAWIRTGLSMMAFGVIIARLRFELAVYHLPRDRYLSSTALGAILIVVGLLAVGVGAWIYSRTARAIERVEYRPTKVLPLILVMGLIALGALSLLYVLGLSRPAGQ